MADFNLGAEVSLDVDPLKASKQTLERNLKDINKSLRSQRSEFKKNELSAEQLAEREKSLGRAVKLQEGLLERRKKDLQSVRDEMSKSNVVTDAQRTKLQSASRAVQQAENQLSNYNRELKETEVAYKQFNRSTDQVKNSLGELKNRAKSSEIAFKQSTRSVDSYKDHLTTMNYTISKSKGNIDLLKKNLREVSNAHGSASRQADKLRNDILKESIAMQIAQGRADELADELKEVEREQRKVALAGTMMIAGFTGARASVDRIATTLRSFGELTQGIVGEVMATQFANLVPIMGSVVSAGAGIGGMLTSLAGGAIGLGGAFGIGMGAINAFAGQATYALKKLEDGELRVTNEVRSYQSALNGLKSSWDGLIAQNQSAIFNTLTNGIKTANYALRTLNPFLTTTASQIENMSGRMHTWVTSSQNARTAFSILNNQGTKAFGNLLNGAYHFFDGTVAVFNKLSPLFVWASKGFENMGLSFRRWANSVEGSKAINSFVQYTKTNLPIVGRIFANVFSGLFNLFGAFAGHSHNVLLGIESVTEGFKQWSAQLKKSDGFQQFINYLETNGPKVWSIVKNISMALWGLIKGMAPVASVTLSLTAAVTQWLASMTNAHPWIGKLLGSTVALTGAMMLFLKPIFLVKGALTGMRGALLAVTGAETLLGKQGAFATLGMKRQAVQARISAIATRAWSVATKAAAFATRGLGLAIRFMSGPIGWVITGIGLLVGAIVYLWKNNETFRNFVIGAWTAIKNTAISVFGFLKPYIVGIWNGIKTASLVVWNLMKTSATLTWNAIKFAIQNPIQALKNALSFIWNGIKAGALFAWNSIKVGVMAIIGGWLALVRANFAMWRTIITGVWNGIKYVSITIWNGIKNGVMAIIRGWIGLVRASFNGLRGFFSAMWNGIKNVSIAIWNGIKNGVITIVRALVGNAKRNISTLRSFISGVWNAIKGISLRVWNAIKNGVVGAIRGLSSGVRKIIGTLRGWIVSAWNYIKNKVIALAKALGAGVKRAFNSLWGAVKKIFASIRNFAVKTWTYIKNKVISLAKGLYSGVKRAFTGTWNFVKRVFNNIKNFSVKVWNYIKNKVVSLAKGLYNGVKRNFTVTWNITKSIFGKLRGWLTKTWKNIKNSVVSHAKGLWSGVKGTWSRLKSGTSSTFGRVKSDTISKWKGMKSSVTGLAKGLWSSVRNTFRNMASGLKTLIGRIKSHISNMVGGVKGGLNKLIGGVNWVAGKLGMDKLPTLKLHTGTTHTQKYVTNGKINQDTFATVGDKGRGNGPGGFRHEMIRYPNGRTAITPNRDTTAFLPKGSRVYNGAQTHSMLNNHPAFATGTLPKFASGTMFNLLGGGKKPKKHKHKDANDSDESLGSKLGNMWGGVKNATSKAVSTGVGWAKAAGKTASKVIGDVLDYIEKPSKLVEKVFDIFGVGVKTFGIPSGAELPFNMMKGMFGKLKKGAIDKVKNWLEESGGGDGGYIKYLDNITTPYSPNGPPPGYAFSWPHPGIDLPYKYEPVYSTISGTARGKEMPGGFGHYIEVIGGALKVIYGHLSKWNIKQGQKVHPGTKLGVSGNTGASTGPHLHYEMHRNGKPIDPVKWLKSHNGGGGKSGGSRAASAWRPEVIKALRANHLPTSGAYVNAWIRQIDSESSGNAGAHQGIHDVNSGGNEAQGLVQVTPSTFRAFKMAGHGNILNGLDNLMAGIHYAKSRYGSSMLGVIGHGHGYAKGTNNARKGFANVFEEGGEIMQMRGGETVIPNDVSIEAFKQIANSDIFARTQSAVYEAISRYADEIRQDKAQKQQEQYRKDMEYQALKEQNNKLTSLVDKMDTIISSLLNIEDSSERTANKKTVIDKFSHEKEVNSIVNKRERNKVRTSKFKPRLT
ncbi:peptidoglycan DD-metalloendopeptidase family protein [Staphylococcus warneri]|uniref:peptidoglycan DD-metalloendopeptidase family protein n=1 Tax=Staphylococcus warneri TaxID=1292 RepID=UPI00191C17A7|nr:peptidoglycan DD-metalloendopeptidase family protein [Staphylococcus warneri]MCK6087796.1 peptidoglycan DD-metalloendopeptidase family protein [Staphylococcus warneri]MCK6166163.1 peptidoglycan DD-metalloendopeptidase family protein [Staphylococcus warneri]MCK6175878.1 peptidoglycan DD-metalloendopeptidase family protein [Staphylococcus warneri]MCK6243624.1 peptidoglycan DD-metalloendopeptidase family protein [Staphylococcus warneri]